MVREIAELRSEVQVVATPWSAPVWMKEPRGIRGGALLDDQVAEYAAMLVAQTEALRASDVPLAALTLGNEPGFSTDYPSMTMTDERQSWPTGSRPGCPARWSCGPWTTTGPTEPATTRSSAARHGTSTRRRSTATRADPTR